MKKVAAIIPEKEFKEYLKEVKEMVAEWKKEGLGYVSCKCQMADMLSGLDDEQGLAFTPGQLKRLFALAK